MGEMFFNLYRNDRVIKSVRGSTQPAAQRDNFKLLNYLIHFFTQP